jgi:uncharacterized protein
MLQPDLVEMVVDHIAGPFGAQRIILFGSYARDEAGPDSDVDLLIVLPEAPDKRQTAIAIRRALNDLPIPKDVIVTTPDEIKRRGHVVGSVLRSALREGRVIYERS